MKLGMIAFLAILGLLIVIFSCKKEADLRQIYTSEQIHSEFLPGHEEVIPLILKFKETQVNYRNGLKTFADMPLDQALWTLEASVNYDFASENDSTTDFVYDTITVYVDSYYENDTVKVDGESLLEAYDDLFDFITEHISDTANTQLIAGDLSVTDTTTTTTTFMLVTITGPYITGDRSINSTDYWYAANGLGMCDETNVGKDAADRIDQVLNWNHGMSIACASGSSLFYTNITVEYLDKDGNGNYYFWNGDDADECLEPTDMAYWVNDVESTIESFRPASKIFIDVDFQSSLDLSNSKWFHMAYPVRYGIPNCISNQE